MRSEKVNQSLARLEHAKYGPNYRNNRGAFTDERGVLVRYGLGHESPDKDDDPRSVDVIGITPTLITQQMVGYYLGVFTAMEIKPEGWNLRPNDKRAIGQDKWMQTVRDNCGYAGFVTDPERDIKRILRLIA